VAVGADIPQCPMDLSRFAENNSSILYRQPLNFEVFVFFCSVLNALSKTIKKVMFNYFFYFRKTVRKTDKNNFVSQSFAFKPSLKNIKSTISLPICLKNVLQLYTHLCKNTQPVGL
jgi:hypothetical protein